MRFLLDENVDVRLAHVLKELGHDVSIIAIDHPASIGDNEVLVIAHREGRILITHDLDFGQLAVAANQPHAGVILFRLPVTTPLKTKIDRLLIVLVDHSADLAHLIVVTLDTIRVRRSSR